MYQPDEYYAEQVGHRLEREQLENVIVFRFTPKSIGKDYGFLTKNGKRKRAHKGITEFRRYVRKAYGSNNVLLELHDPTTMLKDDSKELAPQVVLFYASKNDELGDVLDSFVHSYN
ncbi:MAG: hypothetical protein ACRD38_01330, partial [Nitrososphaerales archaeon]